MRVAAPADQTTLRTVALVDPAVLEMPTDPTAGVMPCYSTIVDWLVAEVDGLGAEQLDFDSHDADKEWMWWSIRRQISHMAWDALVFSRRRCDSLLWPDGDIPSPIVWEHHRIGPGQRYDRVLDESLYWEVPDLLDKLRLGISWLERVVTSAPVDTLRSVQVSIVGTHFWKYVISVLPRGAALDNARPGYMHYDLEASLWMVFYELSAHVRTIQRLKTAQGLALTVDMPRFGYLRLPEYWGETDRNGPSFEPLLG